MAGARKKPPRGAVERALGRIMVSAVRSTRAADALNSDMGFGEIEQQYQVPISGDASETPWFANVLITFDYPMHYAPGQRDSELEQPHFWYGAVLDAQLMYSASVIEWDIDPDNGAYIGATVQLGVLAASARSFTGSLHMTFQGFGALSETDDVGG